MGFSDPVDLPEHGESGLVSVGIFEDLRYYWWVHSAHVRCPFSSNQQYSANTLIPPLNTPGEGHFCCLVSAPE